MLDNGDVNRVLIFMCSHMSSELCLELHSIYERVRRRFRCGGGVEGKSVADGEEDVGSWDEYMGEIFGGGKGRRSGGIVMVIISGCRFWRRSRKCLGLMMGFLGRLKRCRDLEGMEELLGETRNGLGMGHLNRLECSDGEFSGGVAWNFGCRHVVDFSGPGDLEVLVVAGIYGLGRW